MPENAIILAFVNTGCHLEDLPGVMTRKGQGTHLDDDDKIREMKEWMNVFQ